MPLWRRLFPLLIIFAIAAFITGGGTMTDVNANISDMIKIVAVVAFVGAMVALALGMVGDSFRS